MSTLKRNRDATATDRPLPGEVELTEERSRGALGSIVVGDLFSRAILAGLSSGIVFILIEMAWLTTKGKPAVAPLLAISTIFHGTNAPTTIPAQIPLDAVTGLVLHLANSLAFGLGFLPFVIALSRVRRLNWLALAVAGALYGAILYGINIWVFGNYVWPAFTAPGSPQLFSFLVHVNFGFLLAPFFIGMAVRMRRAAHAPAVEPRSRELR